MIGFGGGFGLAFRWRARSVWFVVTWHPIVNSTVPAFLQFFGSFPIAFLSDAPDCSSSYFLFH